ncbi:MAG: hypothetical protein IH881_04150, partial [Myxococcales bacterium]|nr:hypothetical protein [Myxococcales bacterium]
MEWLIGGIEYAIVAGIVGLGARRVWRRYQRCSIKDSNLPNGVYVDWDMFWGR